MKRISKLGSLLLLLAALIPAAPGYAQVSYSTATLRGTVFDPQGGAIPGA